MYEIHGPPLASRLERELPGCQPRLDALSNGAFLIDIHVKGQAFLIEYYPRQRLGLSRLRASGFGWEGVDSEFISEEDLLRHIASL